MKRLLALLLLLSSAALNAQQLDWTNAVNVPNIVVNPTMDNCVSGAPTCGAWKEAGFPLGDWVPAGDGKLYTFSYVQGTLYQDIDLSQYETNLFNFIFSFDLNNSCRNFIGGSCSSIDGPIDPFSVTLKFYDTNGLNNSFLLLSGTPSTANIGCVGGVELLGLCILGQEAQSAWQSFGWYSHVQSDFLFTSARLEFTGNDAGFWGGLYGPSVDNAMLQINYMPPPLPTSGGLAGMNVSAPGSDYIFIFKGNDPILFSQLATKGEDLVGWTAVSSGGEALKITSIQRPDSDYLFLYTEGTPTSGTYYSFQEQPPTVDCVLDPFDPSCIIDTLGIDDGTIDYSDPEQVLASLDTSDTTTDTTEETGSDDGSDDGSSDGTEVVEEEEEVLVADEELDDTVDENLEEMLADSSEEEASEEEEVLVAEETAEDSSEPSLPAVVAAYRELSDEEKAAILADAISKNTLEGALAIASDATAAASGSSASASAATTTQTESSTRTSTTQSSSSSFVAQETTSIESKEEEQKTEMMESSDSASETLETGRQMGREALASTMSQTEQSAAESVSQAESIAMTSSETQTTVVASADSSQTTMVEDVAMAAANKTEEVDDGSRREVQQVVFEDSSTGSMTTETEQQVVAQTETSNEIESGTTIIDTGVEQAQEEKIEMVAATETQTNEQTDTFAELMQMDIKPVIEEKADGDFEFVQQVVAASNDQKQEEINNSGFSEEEKITIANDPALANAFNLAPNVTNLEVAGVLNNKQEEKSDAEKRADEVVAANAKEQEEINKNYMDADQSGIVAAIGADTDVSAYRTAMIRDNNVWYKPEDIYKNIVYKDNVRGSYFLEKGNTDTYKKMVEEQYK